jgi:hypothetical protein
MVQKVTHELLYEVARDNQRTHQLGGEVEDGVNWEVAEDMNFTRPEDVFDLEISPEASRDAQPRTERVAHKSGKLTVAQMNQNERKHWARARQDRWGR